MSEYQVKVRPSDGRACIYMRQYNVVVAEFSDNTRSEQETIASLLDADGNEAINKELLDALKIAEEQLVNCVPLNTPKDLPVLPIIRAAISKAEGRAS
jgi:hypothetical protein